MAESNDLVPIGERHGSLQVVNPANPFQARKAQFSSLNLSTDRGKRLHTRACISADLTTQDVIGQPLRVVDLVCRIVGVCDSQTGEMTDLPRTVLVLDDDRLVSTVSLGVFDCLGTFGDTYGPPPWNPPLEVTMIAKKGKRGTVLLLVPTNLTPKKGK